MIVSVLVIRKDGKVVVVIGDFDKEDNKKKVLADSQLVICLEKFKEWAEQKLNVEVVVAKKPELLSDKCKIAKPELEKLAYRVPLWLHGSSDGVHVTCADKREYKGTEVLADLRSLMERPQVLEGWRNGEVKRIRNLSHATWESYCKSVQSFVEEHKSKKNPMMVKALIETITERATESFIKRQKFLGGERVNMQKQIVYHSFKNSRPENRHRFVGYFRNTDHMMGDILYIKSIHDALNSHSKIFFMGPQSHAQTVSQYLIHGLKYETVFQVPHRSDNRSIELPAIAKTLEGLLR
eukprot:CAMPEP_0167756272 /NCGR_PEP_ID=MMETSP0110_2-20121227/9291_1 /TAXON_ID=629695 /ORGANISM="Gymnochlora sp., Strain CCMP2014" /LENGTH=294 /DNA_ID=CAMNT_0007642359 /DNA_START=3 /DNA_END=884 /DNA_ORIENTATION=+